MSPDNLPNELDTSSMTFTRRIPVMKKIKMMYFFQEKVKKFTYESRKKIYISKSMKNHCSLNQDNPQNNFTKAQVNAYCKIIA